MSPRISVGPGRWEFTGFDPSHAIQNVNKPVDGPSFALDDWLEPTALGTAVSEIPAAKQVRQLRGTNPKRGGSLRQALEGRLIW
jgi:hypothetical protein